MLRTDRGIIQAGRNAVRELNLAMFVLQDVRLRALQYSQRAALEARRVLLGLNSLTACFDAEHLYRSILKEWIEQSDRVGTAADTSHQQIRKAPFFFQHLPACFITNHSLKIANHHRIR